jgi:hypothetical protein
MKDFIFGQLEFQNHISEFSVTCANILDKIMVQPDGLRAVKGVLSLVQQVDRRQEIMVGIVVGVVELQNFISLSIVM